jgi:N-acetylglucosamine-6-phosphate deacetylase
VVNELGIELPAALRMATRSPAAFLGLDGELGSIAPGYCASLVLLDSDFAVHSTWIDGAEEDKVSSPHMAE